MRGNRLLPDWISIFRLSDADREYYDRDDTDRFQLRANVLLLGIILYWSLCIFDLFTYPAHIGKLLLGRSLITVVMITFYVCFLRSKNRFQREILIVAYGTAAVIGLILLGLIDLHADSFYNFGAAVAIFYGGVALYARPAVVLCGASSVILAYSVSLPFTTQTLSIALVDRTLILITVSMVVVSNLYRDQLERAQYEDTQRLQQARKEAEDALERALLADRAKDNLLAGVSHELRTPMNAIIGFSDAMRSELFGKIQPESYRDYVEHIHNSGLTLKQEINNLLDLSTLSVGSISLHETRFHLTDIVADAVKSCRFAAKNARIDLKIDGMDEQVMVCADRERLKQAITNLITNAIKFSPPGNTVTTKIHPPTETGAVISIHDTGCGISSTALENVATPFIQAHTDHLKRGSGGLGIGLAIVTKIMQSMGGTMTIKSAEGEGTVASLRLPLSRIVEPANTQTPPMMRSKRQKKRLETA